LIHRVRLLEFSKIHAHSGSGIEYFKPNSTPDCDSDTDSDADCAFPTALSASPNQAFGSAGGLMTPEEGGKHIEYCVNQSFPVPDSDYAPNRKL
jgi:hypothetical protein